jgi:3-deoxy-D-manno-octulosonic-acid transferase
MRHIYSFLFYCALPLLFARLWWKSKKTPDYRLRWSERLGFIPYLPGEHSIWIHAVSMGEMIAAKPLIVALREKYPDQMLVITTTTVSGSLMASQLVDEKTFHYYLPYDTSGAINRFLNRTKPIQAIIMETELWPNLLHFVAKRNIPILLANARLSEISMKSYLKITALVRPMLAHITCIAAQTQQDADRFMQLGAKPAQIHILGNIKFDVPLPLALIEKGKALRQSWDANRPTVIAASTHPGEEDIVLEAFAQLLKKQPDTLLILVPRHAERANDIADLCQKKALSIVRRTQNQPCLPQTNVFLGDTMGELFLYYAAADVAFVGGSLVRIGGHNLLEPAALGLPVITGPYVFNFTEIFNQLHRAGATLNVLNSSDLYQAWAELINDPQYRKKIGSAGKTVVEENRGAVERHLNHLNL